MDIKVRGEKVNIECSISDLANLLGRDPQAFEKELISSFQVKSKQEISSEKSKQKTKFFNNFRGVTSKARRLINNNEAFTIKDVMGDIKDKKLREWLSDWFEDQDVVLAEFDNPQMSTLVIPYNKKSGKVAIVPLSEATRKSLPYRKYSKVKASDNFITLLEK